MNDRPAVSIVVPTMNAGRTLARCLECARAQSVPVQVVVVDNFSTDATPAIARRTAHEVITAGPERSAQRNIGARAATAGFLMFVDADMYLEPRTAEACLAAYATSHAAVAIPEESFGSGFWASCKHLERVGLVGNPRVAAARFFERALFERIGGYDERLFAGEDWDISSRAERTAGIAFADTIARHDEGRLAPAQLWKKKFYYGRGLARYVRKDPADARRRLSPARIREGSRRSTNGATPLLWAGVAFLKAGEILFGAAGFAIGSTALFRKE